MGKNNSQSQSVKIIQTTDKINSRYRSKINSGI